MLQKKSTFQKILSSRKIQISLYAIPTALVIWVLVNFFQSYSASYTYNFSFNEKSFQKPENSFYIKSESLNPKFGLRGEIDGENFYEILGTPLEFIWSPNEYISSGKKIYFESFLKGDYSLFLSTPCTNCTTNSNTQIPIYLPQLNQYAIAKSFDNNNIFTKNKSNWVNTDNVTDWILKNVPKDSNINIDYLTDKIIDLNKLQNFTISATENPKATISSPFKGNLEAYIYLKDKLDLTVTKRDLNQLQGLDEAELKLEDLNGQLIVSSELEDDGTSEQTSDSTFQNITKKIVYNNIPQAGIYKLSIKSPAEKPNDWIIPSLEFNSDKVVFANKSTFYEPTTIHLTTKTKENILLESKTTITDQDFNIEPKSTSYIQKSSIGNSTNSRLITLDPGTYAINLKPNVSYTGPLFSLAKVNFYNPFAYNLTSSQDSEFYIANYHFETQGEWFKTSTQIPIENIQTQKEISLTLNNDELSQNFKINDDLNQNKFNFIDSLGEFSLWGKHTIPLDNIIKDSPTNWIKNIVPSESKLFVGFSDYAGIDIDEALSNTDEPQGIEYKETKIDVNLRGSHQFLVHLDGTLKASITKMDLNKYDGLDSALITLSDLYDNVICERNFEDNGNHHTLTLELNCNNFKKGTYRLSILGLSDQAKTNASNNDFMITSLSLNTNKILIESPILNIAPITLYTNNKDSKNTEFYFWSSSADNQAIEIDNGSLKDTVFLDHNNKETHIPYLLAKGLTAITFTKGSVLFKGTHASIDPTSWFDVKNISNSDFVLLKSTNKNNLAIRNLAIIVR